ncbi:hypothetical protein C7U65_26145 [Bradyrhizobium sp. WBAH23]|nr:hypothetical protein [Bradyrhizobium sp. WBAH30]MDD1545971.1 hypothetical protein [Bradyrhizobium sp. WBAH41]MDD1559075.1 hypothetical protein [Bradyrhizobium sp. WBAH23]MDD1566175.1 hypothetical protein [Bradyrhizobium sp. WBAH33]MDD1591859.1 hypothetical protein [Bradyrhizobium sp. WBAH42]NRB89848.1 hypothetical protein [Bradyrhizobium sp. WBAH10]
MRERSAHLRRVRALSSWGVPLRRHPHPDPLPQAGEGAHRPSDSRRPVRSTHHHHLRWNRHCAPRLHMRQSVALQEYSIRKVKYHGRSPA